MNLYEIQFEHYAPKDSESGIYTYLVAKDDEEVYEWLKSDPELTSGKHIFTSFEQDEEEYEEDQDEEETYKERILRLKGNINDKDKELVDLYYGTTLVGWKLIKENIPYEYVKIIGYSGIPIKVV